MLFECELYCMVIENHYLKHTAGLDIDSWNLLLYAIWLGGGGMVGRPGMSLPLCKYVIVHYKE